MQDFHQITFVIFTFNEETRIERVIRNFIDFGPILIVDNYSSDRTLEISQRYGCDILLNKNQGWVEDEDTAFAVKSAVKTPWIYWGFADEMLEIETITEIVRISQDDKYSAIDIIKKNYYIGKFCHEVISARLPRVFKKESIDFTNNKIHHFGKFLESSSSIYKMPEELFVHHFMSYTAKSHNDSYNRYSDLECLIGSHTVPIGLLKIMAKAIKRFFYNYFFRGGFKSGNAGKYLILYSIWYDILRDMKLYEMNYHISSDSIEDSNNIVRDKILYNLKKQNLN